MAHKNNPWKKVSRNRALEGLSDRESRGGACAIIWGWGWGVKERGGGRDLTRTVERTNRFERAGFVIVYLIVVLANMAE